MIVDDEPLAVKLLESYVAKTPDLELQASYTDSVEAISAIKSTHPNLLFLDIQMPDLNGMELAHAIPSETRIIFTTAFKEYAFESYEVSALDFLLKPIRYGKFMAAVEKAKSWFGREGGHEAVEEKPQPETTPETIFLRVDGEYRQLTLSQILYVEGMKDYVIFHLDRSWPQTTGTFTEANRRLITHLTMKSVEDMLPASQFMRVNRSYIVALAKIRSVDRNDCIYISDEIIRVTEAYHNKFIQYLNSKFPVSGK